MKINKKKLLLQACSISLPVLLMACNSGYNDRSSKSNSLSGVKTQNLSQIKLRFSKSLYKTHDDVEVTPVFYNMIKANLRKNIEATLFDARKSHPNIIADGMDLDRLTQEIIKYPDIVKAFTENEECNLFYSGIWPIYVNNEAGSRVVIRIDDNNFKLMVGNNQYSISGEYSESDLSKYAEFDKDREFIEPSESDYDSEDEYPYSSNNYAENKLYPAAVLNENFYKLGNPKFIASNTKNGAMLYRTKHELHVGFTFDEPIDFIAVAKKYDVKIKHHYINPKKVGHKIVRIMKVDLGTSGVRSHQQVISNINKGYNVMNSNLYLSSDTVDAYYYDKETGEFLDNLYLYNEAEKYDAERLALSVILANNLHYERDFRQNGVTCYTISRDIILIYNALSEGVKPHDINLNQLKLKANIKFKEKGWVK